MSRSEFSKSVLNQANETVRKLNPELFGLGGLQPKVAQQKVERALDGKSSGRQAGGHGMDRHGPYVRVALISFRARELDRDNLIGGLKPLRDAIARWLGLDDSDRVIEWEYGQQVTKGRHGTAVRIEKL